MGVAGVVLALVTACTAPVSPAPSTVSGPAVSVSSGTPTAIPGYVEAREGVDYEVLFDVPNPRPDGRTDGVLAVTPDGQALVKRMKQTVPLSEHSQVLLKTADGERVLPRVLAGPPRVAIYGAAHGVNTAWLETSSTQAGLTDWDLFGADNDGHVRHLAASGDYDAGDGPSPPEATPVVVDATRAYFTVVLPRKNRGTGNEREYRRAILAAPLDGSRPTIIDDARLPAVGADGLHFVRSTDILTWDDSTTPARGVAEFGVIPPGGQSRIVHTEKLAPGREIVGHCAVGDNLVWLTSNDAEGGRGHITILAPDGTRTTIPLNEDGFASYLTCGDGLIAWSGGGEDGTTEDAHGDIGQYVYSLATRTTWRIGENDIVSECMVNGKIVMVSSPAQNETGPVGSRVLRWLH
ncbi:hypothetical protein [Propionicicella superfundia]|uniref:hypothetical protein n=1 Tax=Propionicicella superfundia TaxID=348582 RepID=UPI0012ECBA43|nr:hypothetical protein [Propionicicella superfundia]